MAKDRTCKTPDGNVHLYNGFKALCGARTLDAVDTQEEVTCTKCKRVVKQRKRS